MLTVAITSIVLAVLFAAFERGLLASLCVATAVVVLSIKYLP